MYGKVVDVYVLSKCDKRRKRFGFVQLTGVKNELQMEKKLNGIWIGSYKMRVKIAEDRQRKPFLSRRIQGTVKENETKRKMLRLVQPGQSYAQVVRGQGKREEKASVQSQNKEEEATSDKEGDKTRVEENMVEETREEIIEFTPIDEELQWLEGGMVAMVRSLAMISEIQERIDVDGSSILLSPIGGRRVLLTERVAGYLSEYMKLNEELFNLWFESIKPWEMAPEERSRMVWLHISRVPLKAWGERCFKMVGETVGEVLMIHEDTKEKSILWDERLLVLCPNSSKLAKRIKLKVEDKVYEVEIVEEEWCFDPEWWLSENDQKSEHKAESNYLVSWNQNEDLELDTKDTGSADDVNVDLEHLMKDMVSNSNLKLQMGNKNGNQIDPGLDFEGAKSHGLSKEDGPQKMCSDGPEKQSGLVNSMDLGQTKEMSIEGPILSAQKIGDSLGMQKLKNRVFMSKRQRPIQDCYPESMEEIWVKGTPWVTPRTR
ncbi:hypothetical protein SLA2020_232600 [Shorea laevis]